MQAVVDFPNRDAIETEACAWIAQLDGDRTPSEEDIAALKEWMRRSPIHQQELLRLAELWGDLNILTELAVPAETKGAHPARTLAARLKQKNATFWQYLGNGLTPAYRMSMALVTIIGLSFWYNQQISPVHLTYSTAPGEQRLATLPDGSTLQLNTATQVEIDYSKDLRKIRLLKGEAHFQVAHNRNRPFEVYAGDGVVRAVGTAFSVYLKNRDVEVTVTEGRVELAALMPPTSSLTPSTPPTAPAADQGPANSSPGNSQPAATDPPVKMALATLEAGQTTTFGQVVQPVKKLNSTDVMRKLSWRDGMLIFSGESLEEVVQQVSRYTNLSIVIADPDIRDVRIGGYFQVGKTDAMFDALETSFGVQVERISSTEVQLSRAEQSPSLQ